MLSLRLLPSANSRSGRRSGDVRHVLAYDRGGVAAAFGWRRDGELWLEVPDVATFQLPANGAELTAVPEGSADSAAVLDAYYGTALPLVVQATRGLEVLHASAVLCASSHSVVALCGISESGKSTSAYGLAARGHGHWADDAVAFRVADAHSVNAIGLPFTVNLRARSAAHFRAPSERLEVMEAFEWKSSPLGAVFLLQPTETEQAIAIERLGSGEALHALLPNAYRFRPSTDERRRETMRAYLELVASVPISAVRFAPRLDRLPDLLDELEERMPALS